MDTTLKYAQSYIKQVTSQKNVGAPDQAQAGQHYGILLSLYENHTHGGLQGAIAGWNVLKKIYPHLETTSKLINFHELGNLPIPDYILPTSDAGTAPNYPIYKSGLNLIYSAPGSGKSFVAIDIAARVSLANPNHIIIYSAGEGIPGLNPRLRAWEKHHGHEVHNLYLWKEALPFSKPEAVEAFLNEVADKQPAFIIIDTLARAMVGLNENDTREMGLFIQSVETLMTRLNCGMLFVHHTNKLGMMRGSTALEGSMDSIIRLQKEETLISLFNSLERGGKNKHREEAPPIHLRLLPVVINGNNEATIVPSEKVIDDPNGKLTSSQVSILDAVAGFADGLTAKAISDMTNLHIATVYRSLKRMSALKFVEDDNERWSITASGDKARSS
jgi:DNA-binding NarL/FixJ family response regulator